MILIAKQLSHSSIVTNVIHIYPVTPRRAETSQPTSFIERTLTIQQIGLSHLSVVKKMPLYHRPRTGALTKRGLVTWTGLGDEIPEARAFLAALNSTPSVDSPLIHLQFIPHQHHTNKQIWRWNTPYGIKLLRSNNSYAQFLGSIERRPSSQISQCLSTSFRLSDLASTSSSWA